MSVRAVSPEIDYLSLVDHGSDDAMVSAFLREAARRGSVAAIDGCPYYTLEVRLDADPQRTHGVGANLLHIDYVAHRSPPRMIGLLCLRSDPRGGGATVLAPFNQAVAGLTDDQVAALEEPVFRYFSDPTGGPFGPPVERFSILSDASGFIRFTAKMLATRPPLAHEGIDPIQPRHLAALAALADRLAATATVTTLRRGEAVFFDQRAWVHGRQALGPDQQTVPAGQRRVLIQSYVV